MTETLAAPPPLSLAQVESTLRDLAALMRLCVEDGASINFVQPFPQAEAETWWRETVLPGVAAGTRLVWAARIGKRVAGSVQLDLATPPNQPHRADVTKLLVHPKARRRGLGRAMMETLEAGARAEGRLLLTLDTLRGSAAEGLYRRMGYVEAGEIPGFSLDPRGSGRLDTTVIYWKRLG